MAESERETETELAEARAWLAGWWRGRNRRAPWWSQMRLIAGEALRYGRVWWRVRKTQMRGKHGGRGAGA